ncbi:MAG TPA: peptidoglycan DD-metalloendopeptidase family protein [Vicinamibacterales bacterium]|jgi:septal ring factor EnvC (AmiA/AmiB activator)
MIVMHRSVLALCIATAILLSTPGAHSQTRSQTEAQARRATDRIQALQREADALAAQEKTLLVELRQLEIERDLQSEKLRKVGADLDMLTQQIDQTSARVENLEKRRESSQPALESRLVELYKLGGGGYARLLLGVNDLRQFGRAYRTVAAMAELDRQQIEEHRRTLDALKAERGTLTQRRASTAKLQRDARTARAALDRATMTRTALVAEIDARRDLNARLASELQGAHQRLQQMLAGVASVRSEPVTLPLRAFQHDLDWPALGRVTARFGRRTGLSPTSSLNGIEIGAIEGAPVRAVHEGTIAYAEPFTGYGNLVIIDHGAQAYSLYGYLASLEIARGARIERGELLGSAGQTPTGAAALYFELRIDGKAVDPVEWLKRR